MNITYAKKNSSSRFIKPQHTIAINVHGDLKKKHK